MHAEFDRIKLLSEDLKRDIELMVDFVQIIFRDVRMIALYRMMEESNNDFQYDDIEFNKEQEERMNLAKENIEKMLSLTKEF